MRSEAFDVKKPQMPEEDVRHSALPLSTLIPRDKILIEPGAGLSTQQAPDTPALVSSCTGVMSMRTHAQLFIKELGI